MTETWDEWLRDRTWDDVLLDYHDPDRDRTEPPVLEGLEGLEDVDAVWFAAQRRRGTWRWWE